MIDEKLLQILACPACKGPISLQGDWLVCGQCRLRYPVRDGIPIMLVEGAEPLADDGGESDTDR